MNLKSSYSLKYYFFLIYFARVSKRFFTDLFRSVYIRYYRVAISVCNISLPLYSDLYTHMMISCVMKEQLPPESINYASTTPQTETLLPFPGGRHG